MDLDFYTDSEILALVSDHIRLSATLSEDKVAPADAKQRARQSGDRVEGVRKQCFKQPLVNVGSDILM